MNENVYRAECTGCGLDHLWNAKHDAEKDKMKHEYLTGHKVAIRRVR